MTRVQLEHVLRAAGTIADDTELIVLGSQALLGAFPDAPPALRVSVEVDLYPKNHPERADLVDGCIGEGSPFHATFGYYAQGVDASTATLPDGWQLRLIPVHNANTAGVTGWCLEPHDLVISKLIAGREKDRSYATEAARHGLIESSALEARLAVTTLDDARRRLVLAAIRALPGHAR
jgi:hypothetical protein